MHRLSIAVIAAVSGIAQIAFAADLPVKAPALTTTTLPPVYNWTGFYVGVNGGYGWGETSALVSRGDTTTLFVLFGVPQDGRADVDLDGGIFGGQVGFNYQLHPTWLVGIEADLQWSDIKGSGSGTIDSVFSDPFFGFTPFAIDADARLKWFGTVRGRVGYLPVNNLLIYVTGGLAFGRIENSVNVTQTYPGTTTASSADVTVICVQGVPCYSGSNSRTSVGWTGGGGLEYRLWRNVSLKAEYLFMSLNAPNFFVPAVNSTPPGVGGLTAEFDDANIHMVRLGMNWLFN